MPGKSEKKVSANLTPRAFVSYTRSSVSGVVRPYLKYHMNLNALLHITVPQAPSAGELPEQGEPPKNTEGASFAEDLQSYLDIPPQVAPAAVVPAAMPMPTVPEIGQALLDGVTPPTLATVADLLSPSPPDMASVPAAVGGAAAIPAFPLVDVTINAEQPPVIGEFNPALAVQPQGLPSPASVSDPEVRFLPQNTETVLPTLPETQVSTATPAGQETPMSAALPNVTPASSAGETSALGLGLPVPPTAATTVPDVSPPAAATEMPAAEMRAPRAGSVEDLLSRRTPDQGFTTASTLSASATPPKDDPAAALPETSARPADVAQAALNGLASPEGPSSRPALPVNAQLGNAILARLEVRTRENRTEFHMNLEPPELGSVRVHLTITDNTVTARMMVHEESARQLIESQMHSLRQRLMEAGISVGRFEVTQDGAGTRDHPRHRMPEPFPLPGALAADALRQPRLPGELLASKRLIDIMV